MLGNGNYDDFILHTLQECLFLNYNSSEQERASRLNQYLIEITGDLFNEYPAKQQLIQLLIEVFNEEIDLLRKGLNEHTLKQLTLEFSHNEATFCEYSADFKYLREHHILFPGIIVDNDSRRAFYLGTTHRSLQKEEVSTYGRGKVTLLVSPQPQELKPITGQFYSLQNIKKATVLLSRLINRQYRFNASTELQSNKIVQLLDDEIKLLETLCPPYRPHVQETNPSRSWLNPEQNNAINTFRNLPFYRTMNIIGPPGSGKTGVISCMTREFVDAGYKVILVSPSYVPLFHVAEKLNHFIEVDYCLLHHPETRTPETIKHFAYRSPDYSDDRGISGYRSQCRVIAQSVPVIITTTYALHYVFPFLQELVQDILAGGAYNQRHAKRFKPLAIIIDESSKLSLVDFLYIIYMAKQSGLPFKICLVGDPAQLSPFSAHTKRLNINLSIFDILQQIKSIPRVELNQIYRLRNPLLKIISDTYYEGRLFGAPQQGTHSETRLIQLKHDGLEERSSSTGSFANPTEASLIIRHIQSNNAIAEIETIAIITPYAQQKELFDSLMLTLPIPLRTKIKILTFDACQGAEFDLVYISLTRHTTSKFTEEPHRMNVALTRAKKGCFLTHHKSYIPETTHFERILKAASPDVDTQSEHTFPSLFPRQR